MVVLGRGALDRFQGLEADAAGGAAVGGIGCGRGVDDVDEAALDQVEGAGGEDNGVRQVAHGLEPVEHRVVDGEAALGHEHGQVDHRAEQDRHGPGERDDPRAGGGPGDPGARTSEHAHDGHDRDQPLVTPVAEDEGHPGERLDDGVEPAVGVVLHVQGQGGVDRQEPAEQRQDRENHRMSHITGPAPGRPGPCRSAG